MAIIIPDDLGKAAGARSADVYVAEHLQELLPADITFRYNPQAARSSLTSFLGFSTRFGLIALEVLDCSPLDFEKITPQGIRLAGGKILNPEAHLGQKMTDLLTQLQGTRIQRLNGLLLLPNFRERDLEASAAKFFSRQQTIFSDTMPDMAQRLRPIPIDETALEESRCRLYPELEFSKPRLVLDDDRARRETQRITLNQCQEQLARSLDSGITLLTGVAGSGKSLVLSARARYLSTQNPDWEIAFLCFNKSLVTYLQSMVGDYPKVNIANFHKMAWHQGIKLRWSRDDDMGNDPDARTIDNALQEGKLPMLFDAVLVDEAQDFAPSWLKLCTHIVRPGRGGVVLAADLAQSLYREVLHPLPKELSGIRMVDLNHSYRTTRQIGNFAYQVIYSSASGRPSKNPYRFPRKPEFLLDGFPVQLVWAENWDGQAEFIAWEIDRLISNNLATYRDIAILYTQRMAIVGRLLRALEAKKIPYFWVNRDKDAKAELNLEENSVKLLTVHSGKGLEFPYVFLMGVEALKVPKRKIEYASEEEAAKARIAYVGMTRAQDLLYLTYTRLNAILDRALAMKDSDLHEYLQWPEDFK